MLVRAPDSEWRLSAWKIGKADSEFAEAIAEGLTWTVLDKVVAQLYPGLPDLIQRARNAVAQTHNSESNFEMLLEIQNMAVQMEKGST